MFCSYNPVGDLGDYKPHYRRINVFITTAYSFWGAVTPDPLLQISTPGLAPPSEIPRSAPVTLQVT